jgi:hypothetical protein
MMKPKSILNPFRSSALRIALLCALALATTRAAQPPQATAPAVDQQSSACGAQSHCYDTPHFAATVTTFRTSTVNDYKLIDTSIRFLNKTNQPLVVGYVNGSGFATDDRGNRSAVGGPNGYRGIGVVVGNNFDPKLVVRAGGWGEAQFELVLQGASQVIGSNYALDITVAEIKTEGNQHMLDGEFPLHFEGLANRVSQGTGNLGGAPASAANAISNLKSLFGKKKAAQNAASVADAAANTASAVNAAANSATNAAAGQPSSAPAANTPGQAAPPSVASTSAEQQATPSSANAVGQQAKTRSAGDRAPIRPGGNSTAPQSAEPWTPPADGSTPTARSGSVSIDPAKMPDVIGIHLGMDPKEALAIMHSDYPKNLITSYDHVNLGMFPANVFQGSYINATLYEDNFIFHATLPPEKQLVWKVRRVTKRMHINRQTLLAALRAKYGKESAAIGPDEVTPTSNDAEISLMLWFFDESGHHVPLSNSSARMAAECTGAARGIGEIGLGGSLLVDEASGKTTGPLISQSLWCKTSYVGVRAEFGVYPIIETVTTDMTDLPLAVRTSHSTAVWYRAQAERARQQDLEKSKQVKPVF